MARRGASVSIVHRRLAVLALTLTAVLGLSACGGDDSSTAGSGTGDSSTADAPGGDQAATPAVDLCALLTQDQVAAAMGKPVGPGQLEVVAGSDVCSWSADSSQGVDGTNLIAMTQTIFDGTLKGAAEIEAMGVTIEPVEGLGEAAYFQIDGETEPMLAFAQDGNYLFLTVNNENFNQQQAKDAELQLARQAVANL